MSVAGVEGVGVLFRDAFAEALLGSDRPPVDWLEIVPEDFVERGAKARRTLDALAARFTLVPHAVSLSLGGVDPLDHVLLDRLTGIVRELDPPWWSEHLGCVRVDGAYTQAVLPLPMSEEAALHLGARARRAAERVGTPLILENFAAYAVMPGSALEEAAFLHTICEASGCDLLLDVTNIWLNAKNFGHDAAGVIDRLPIERVREIHLAGYEIQDGFAIDSHSRPVPEEVWPLYRRVIARARKLIPTLIEWEVDLPPAERLFQEVHRARREAALALGGAR